MEDMNKKSLPQTYWQSTVRSSERKQYVTPRDLHASELLKRLTGWVDIASQINARSAAAVPLYLYKNKRKSAFSSHSINEKNSVEVKDHPVLSLMREPTGDDDLYDGYQMRLLYHYSQEATGDAVFAYDDDKILFLQPDYVRVVPSDQLRLNNNRDILNAGDIQTYLHKNPNIKSYHIRGAYIYGREVSNAMVYNRNEILHGMLMPDLQTPYKGRTWVDSILTNQDLWISNQKYINTLMLNNGIPEHIIYGKGNVPPDKQKEFAESIEDHMKSAFQRGLPTILSGNLDLQVLSLQASPKDASLLQFNDEAKKIVLAAAGIPESFVELNSANLASATTAQHMYLKNTIMPRVKQEAAVWTKFMHKHFAGTEDMFFAPEDLDDRAIDSTIAINAYNSGIITRNQASAFMGFDTTPDGDLFKEEAQIELLEVEKNEQPTVEMPKLPEVTIDEPSKGFYEFKNLDETIKMISDTPAGVNGSPVTEAKSKTIINDIWKIEDENTKILVDTLMKKNLSHKQIANELTKVLESII
jgi:hypothetical protein